MENAVQTEKLLLSKEYGSNILKLVEFLLTIEDKEERTKQAELLKKLIFKMNPSLKYTENADQIVWNAMDIMSDLQLNINVEFEKLDLDIINKKPIKVEYTLDQPKYKHYGKNIELIADKIVAEPDPEKKIEAIIGMGKLMKMFYENWNKENCDNRLIANQISKLSDGKIIVPEELLKDDQVFDTKKLNKNNINQGTSVSNINAMPRKNNNRNKNNNNRNRNTNRK